MTADSVTQFYAPRARLVDVTTGVTIGGSFTTDPRDPSAGTTPTLDLVSARITLVHTNVSQLSVVLNNQIFGPGGLPRTPPWLYNAFDRIKFGQWVRLDICYGDQPWTKMIVAQINDMQFSFASTGAQVTVIGEDLLSVFKRKPDQDKRYPAGQTEEQIVRDVVTRAGGTPAFAGSNVVTGARDPNGIRVVRGSLVAWPTITEDLPSITHAKAQSYLQFLQSIADRLDFEIFVDFAQNYLPLDEAGDPVANAPRETVTQASEVLLHFEPARSLLAGGEPSFVADLAWGFNLVDFTPKLKVWDLVSGVNARGRNPGSLQRINHEINDPGEVDGIVARDLGRISGGPFLTPATAMRRQLLANVQVPTAAPLEVDVTNLGEQRARLMAIAKLLDKARELITVDATTVGFPSLRAGIHVDVSGMYAPFDGLYYVTQAVHTFDSNGYRTQLTLRRPGLESPDNYIWSLARTERAS